jgi:hypothetical protein
LWIFQETFRSWIRWSRKEQEGADVLGPEVFGRGVEVLGEIGDPLDVASGCLEGQVVEGQVLGHATAQRRHGVLPSRWCARAGSPSAAFMIGERSRACMGDEEPEARGMRGEAREGEVSGHDIVLGQGRRA